MLQKHKSTQLAKGQNLLCLLFMQNATHMSSLLKVVNPGASFSHIMLAPHDMLILIEGSSLSSPVKI